MALMYTLLLINIINFVMLVYLITKKNDTKNLKVMNDNKTHTRIITNDFGNPFATYQNKQNLYEPVKPKRGVNIKDEE